MRFAPPAADARLTSSFQSRDDAIRVTIPDRIPDGLSRLRPDENKSPLKSLLPASPASQLIKVPTSGAV